MSEPTTATELRDFFIRQTGWHPNDPGLAVVDELLRHIVAKARADALDVERLAEAMLDDWGEYIHDAERVAAKYAALRRAPGTEAMFHAGTEAGERVGRAKALAAIEALIPEDHYAPEEWSVTIAEVRAILSGEGPAEADPPASAPGPLDPAAEGYVVVVDRSLPCPLDPKCYRYQGHDGEHMYAEPPAQQLNHAISASIASTPPKKKHK